MKQLKSFYLQKILFSILFLLTSINIEAQISNEVSYIKLKVNAKYNGSLIVSPDNVGYYYEYINDVKKAEEIKSKIINNDGKLSTVEEIRSDYGILRSTRGIGNLRAYKGVYILVVLSVPTDAFTGVSGFCDFFEIKEGQSNYELTFNLPTPILKDVLIDGTVPPPPPPPTPPLDKGKYATFTMQLPLDSTYKTNNRLIIQPVVTNCNSGDITAYLPPYVFEGKEYHTLQDKRMYFDYLKNDVFASTIDPVNIEIDVSKSVGESNHTLLDSIYYKNDIVFGLKDSLLKNDTIRLRVTFKKPEGEYKTTFRCDWKCSLEDYLHVVDQFIEEGTCLQHRPFKFLDFSASTPEMPLTNEFYQEADDQEINVNRDLNLRFEQGGTRIINDSLNNALREKLFKEVNDDIIITGATVIGTASPDGSDVVNKRLALERANTAQSYLSGAKLKNVLNSDVHLYTWSDVASRLAKKGFNVEADEIRAIVNSYNDERTQDNKIALLPYYKTIVASVLPEFRVMKFSYKYTTRKRLEADEVVDVYLANKKQYMANPLILSAGDYFNLFSKMKDSLELDTITMLAYSHLKALGGNYYENKLAPYVFNRMQILMQKQNQPTTDMLKPFLNDTIDVNFEKLDTEGNPVQVVNRDYILATQAISYYLIQEYDTARIYIDKLMKSSRTKMPSAFLNKLQHFINLQDYYLTLDPEKKMIFNNAKQYVMGQSILNKAVIYTEFKDETYPSYLAHEYVNSLPDADPKKWYLKALLSFKDYYNKKEPLLSGMTLEMEQKGIPQYLAYLHHCFTLDPSFKRYYFIEGHISEYMRAKNPYSKKNLSVYEEMFKLLKFRDDKERDNIDAFK